MSKKNAIETFFRSLYELAALNGGNFERDEKEEETPVVLKISEIVKEWEGCIIEDISAGDVNAQIWTDKKSGDRILVFFKVIKDYSFPKDFVILDSAAVNPIELVSARAANNELVHAA